MELHTQNNSIVVCGVGVPTDVGTFPLPISLMGSRVNVSGRAGAGVITNVLPDITTCAKAILSPIGWNHTRCYLSIPNHRKTRN